VTDPAPGPGAEGRIVLVGTPIGNLGDLSPRAVSALATADVIFCEDTRRTRKLLSASGIRAQRLVVMHQHNEAASADYAVDLAAGGATVAVVTDAGMPGISDPGERVVVRAAASGVKLEVVPGPSAGITALVASGLASSRFCFEGFLPRRGRPREQRLRDIAGRDCTSVVYEAPHRVAGTIVDLAHACGSERQVAVGRELTKLHEEMWRGTLGRAVEWVAESEPRGEWVLVVEGSPVSGQEHPSDAQILDALRLRVHGGDDRRGAVAAVASDLGVPKRDVYRLALDLDPSGLPGK
jgi:16S rRNA (cytidine1402-2'-O)-methyltransferase